MLSTSSGPTVSAGRVEVEGLVIGYHQSVGRCRTRRRPTPVRARDGKGRPHRPRSASTRNVGRRHDHAAVFPGWHRTPVLPPDPSAVIPITRPARMYILDFLPDLSAGHVRRAGDGYGPPERLAPGWEPADVQTGRRQRGDRNIWASVVAHSGRRRCRRRDGVCRTAGHGVDSRCGIGVHDVVHPLWTHMWCDGCSRRFSAGDRVTATRRVVSLECHVSTPSVDIHNGAMP